MCSDERCTRFELCRNQTDTNHPPSDDRDTGSSELISKAIYFKGSSSVYKVTDSSGRVCLFAIRTTVWCVVVCAIHHEFIGFRGTASTLSFGTNSSGRVITILVSEIKYVSNLSEATPRTSKLGMPESSSAEYH